MSDGTARGSMSLPTMDGREVSPGVWLVGEPTPIPGTDKMRRLADMGGCLCLVELKVRFAAPTHPLRPSGE